MNEKWTDDLRQMMEQYESAEVPEGLWEGIEQRLDQSPRAVVVHWWRRLAAACVAIAIVSVATMFFFFDKKDEKTLTEKTPDTIISKQKAGHSNILADVEQAEKGFYSKPKDAETITKPVEMPEEEHATTTEEPAITEQEPSVAIVEDRVPSSPSKRHDCNVIITHNGRSAASGGTIRIDIYTSQLPNDQSDVMNGYLALSPQGCPDNTPHMMSKGKMGSMDYLALVNDGANPVTKAYHQQPVRIGFSIGYDIDRRWGVSIGASYTKLNSTLTAGTESSYYSNNQAIKYIGIPLGLTYNILRNRYLRLYATAGSTVEFCAGGETQVQNIISNRLVSTEEHKIHDAPTQLSANIGGGAELNVYKSLGIFAEAGAAYFFDNNSKYTTIYSTHPLNLNLQFGVRWTINSKE